MQLDDQYKLCVMQSTDNLTFTIETNYIPLCVFNMRDNENRSTSNGALLGAKDLSQFNKRKLFKIISDNLILTDLSGFILPAGVYAPNTKLPKTYIVFDVVELSPNAFNNTQYIALKAIPIIEVNNSVAVLQDQQVYVPVISNGDTQIIVFTKDSNTGEYLGKMPNLKGAGQTNIYTRGGSQRMSYYASSQPNWRTKVLLYYLALK